jgi:hypothetical protein
LLSYVANKPIPICLRHTDVADNNVRLERQEELLSFRGRRGHRWHGFALNQQASYKLPRVRLILHHEHFDASEIRPLTPTAIAARRPITVTTTISSTMVKPLLALVFRFLFRLLLHNGDLTGYSPIRFFDFLDSRFD